MRVDAAHLSEQLDHQVSPLLELHPHRLDRFLGPRNAATAACWESELGFEVLASCTLFIPEMISAGPQAQPRRRPVIAYALEQPLTSTVRPFSSGATWRMLVAFAPA